MWKTLHFIMNYLNFTTGLIWEKRLVFDMRPSKTLDRRDTVASSVRNKPKEAPIDLHLKNLIANSIHSVIWEGLNPHPQIMQDHHFTHIDHHEKIKDRVHHAIEHNPKVALHIIDSIKATCQRVMGMHHVDHERHKHASDLHQIVDEIRLSIDHTADWHLSHINDPHEMIDAVHTHLDEIASRERLKIHYPDMYDSDKLVKLSDLVWFYLHKPICRWENLRNVVDIWSWDKVITQDLIEGLASRFWIDQIPFSYIWACPDMFSWAEKTSDVAEKLNNVHWVVETIHENFAKVSLKEARLNVGKNFIY